MKRKQMNRMSVQLLIPPQNSTMIITDVKSEIPHEQENLTNFDVVTDNHLMLAHYLACPYYLLNLPVNCPSEGEKTCACIECIADWLNQSEKIPSILKDALYITK